MLGIRLSASKIGKFFYPDNDNTIKITIMYRVDYVYNNRTLS